MSKKNNKISINALEKYCGQFNTEPQDIEIHYGEDEVFTFTVKPLLTMDESVRFIEEVVRECIMPDDMLIVPIARDFITKKNLMTYYANLLCRSRKAKPMTWLWHRLELSMQFWTISTLISYYDPAVN